MRYSPTTAASTPIPAHSQERGAGWQADLQLQFTQVHSASGSKTVLAKVKHRGPLRVQRPFYPERGVGSGVCHVYMLHPPGGVVGGDVLNVRVHAEQGAQALLTTPGSTKFYRTQAHTATVQQVVVVEEAGLVEWFPQESIYFPAARVATRTSVDLRGSGQFIGWDIQSLGRPVNAEVFECGRVASFFTLCRDGAPVLLESFRVDTSDGAKDDLQRASGLRGFPMQATFVATGCNKWLLEQCREALAELLEAQPQLQSPYGLTLLEDDVLVLRVLGERTERVQRLMIEVWQLIRPHVAQREAVLPRIWAT